MWHEYHIPGTIEEALELLKSGKGRTRVIAGGTDLVIEFKEGLKDSTALVDITEIVGLGKIEQHGDYLSIGAGVTHAQAAASKLLQNQATALAEASWTVGSPQIRNTGTVVGNVVNAQPAADAAVALVALNAEAEVADLSGTRRVPVEDLYEGVGKSRVKSAEEIVIGLFFQAQTQNQGSAFVRLAHRKALALPVLNVAVKITTEADRCTQARIVVAPVAPRPFRALNAEALLTGEALTPETLLRAGEETAAECNPRDSALRGSAEYRREMIKVMVRRALCTAMMRIQTGDMALAWLPKRPE